MGSKKPQEEFSFHPFSDLRKKMDKKGIRLGAGTSRHKFTPKINIANDPDIFADAMKDVREIREFRDMPARAKRSVPVRRQISEESGALKTLQELTLGQRPVRLSDTQEYVEWVHPSYGADIAGKLHEGVFSVQSSLDLHGLTLDEADAAVKDFLREAMVLGYRCVKIIHGRGLRSPNGPVLKQMLVRLLQRRYRKNIIAFVTARQCDGGLGALYILFR